MELDSFITMETKNGRAKGEFKTNESLSEINRLDRKPFDLTLIVGDKRITFYIPAKNGYGEGGIFRNALLLEKTEENLVKLKWTPAYEMASEGFYVNLTFKNESSGTFELAITNMERFRLWREQLNKTKAKGIKKTDYSI